MDLELLTLTDYRM